MNLTHLHCAGALSQAPATGQPQQKAAAATGSAAVRQQPPSTQPDAAADPAAAQQRRLQGPQQANGQGQHQAPGAHGSAAGASSASRAPPQLFLPQQTQRRAPQQQVATGRSATPPLKKPAPGPAPSPTGRAATPPLKKPAPVPEPDYAAAFESAAKAIPLAGKPRRRRTSGSLVGGTGDASRARAPSKSKKAAMARKDAVSPQVQHRRRLVAV